MKTMTVQDIPTPKPGRSKYWPGPSKTSGPEVDVLELPVDSGGHWKFVKTLKNLEAAVARCIILQHIANDTVHILSPVNGHQHGLPPRADQE